MSGIITRMPDHDLACKPQRKSNGLEYRPFMVNSQNSVPLQYRRTFPIESLEQRSDISYLACIEVPPPLRGRGMGVVQDSSKRHGELSSSKFCIARSRLIRLRYTVAIRPGACRRNNWTKVSAIRSYERLRVATLTVAFLFVFRHSDNFLNDSGASEDAFTKTASFSSHELLSKENETFEGSRVINQGVRS